MISLLIDLTRELLASGVFNHLPDNEIARLRWLLQGGQEEGILVKSLFSYWYRGDYYTSQCPPYLLQQCNGYLLRMGKPLIDAFGEEFYEV